MSRIFPRPSWPLAGLFVGACIAGPLVAQIVPADTRHLFSIRSLTAEQFLGERGLEFLGDVDKDGFDDFAFAQRGDLQVASGRTGLLLYAIPQRNSTIASIEDFDNDGVRDFVRGENIAGSNGNGLVELRSGRDGKVLHSWPGSAGQNFGLNVANLGDVDKDGVEDFGAGSNSGYHVFSGRTRTQLHLFTTHGRGTYAGDVDGDQHDDVLLGNPSAGSAELRSGKTGARIGSTITIPNCSSRCSFPYAMIGGRDVDGDKVPDFVIGNHRPTRTIRVYSGKTRSVVRTITLNEGRFGTSLAWIGDLTQDGFPEIVARIDASVGIFDVTPKGRGLLVRINGVSGSQFGWSVAGGGDLNADGSPDFLVSCNVPSPYVAGYSGKPLGLTSDRLVVPGTGGVQKLTGFTSGNLSQNRWWLVLGSLSRSTCTKLGAICVPLQIDPYFTVVLENAPALGLVGKQLPLRTEFNAQITVPALPASLLPVQLWHSTILIDLPAVKLSTPSAAIGLYVK